MFAMATGRRVRMSLAATALGLMSLIAWAPGPSSEAAVIRQSGVFPPRLQRGVTLRIGDLPTSGEYLPVLARVVATWSAHTGDHVKLVGGISNFCTGAPQKAAPDLVGGPHNELGALVGCKAIAPVPAWAWPAAARKTYLHAAVRAMTVDGAVHAMPWSIGTSGIFFNRRFVGANLFAPTKGDRYPRWNAVIAKAHALTTSHRYGYVQPIADLYYSYAFLHAFGGYIFRRTEKGYDDRDIGLDTVGAVRGMRFLKNLTTTGQHKLMPPTMDESTADRLFGEGKAAMVLDGPWAASLFPAIRYGFVPLPSIDGAHPMHPLATVNGFAVNAYSRHKNEAFSLQRYLSTHLASAQSAYDHYTVPVLTRLLHAALVQSNPLSRVEVRAVQHADLMPNIPEMEYVWRAEDDALSATVNGQVAPEAAARAAVVEIQASIAKEQGD